MQANLGVNAQDLSREELERRLHKLEDAYQNCQRLSLSNDFAAAVMHEVNNPLEAITNLVYLVQNDPDTDLVAGYLQQVQEQLIVLASIARSSLAFYKGQNEAREIDLSEIAESALELHFLRLQRGRVRIETDYCSDAVVRGIGSEILQVLSNLVLNAVDSLADTSEPSLKVTVRRTRAKRDRCVFGMSLPNSESGVRVRRAFRCSERHRTRPQ